MNTPNTNGKPDSGADSGRVLRLVGFEISSPNIMTTTTLRLGEGKTSVAAFYGDKGSHGIGFFPAPEGTKSGDTWSDPENIETVEESDCFLLITATNPDALQVMIDQLKAARRKMREELGEIAKPSKEGFAQQY